MNKLHLGDLTLVTVSSVNIRDTIDALMYCCKAIRFAEVKLITHTKPDNLPSPIQYCRGPKIASLDEYSRFMLYDLHRYIDTPFCLTIHRDGVVVNPGKWREEFLSYDYIGAPWPIDDTFKTSEGVYQRVGNGGFSLRSKRLLEFPEKSAIPFESDRNCLHEDVLICVTYRHLFESNAMKIAGIDIARYFAHEIKVPEIKGIKPFGFHKYRKQNRFYPRFPSTFTKLRRKLNKYV